MAISGAILCIDDDSKGLAVRKMLLEAVLELTPCAARSVPANWTAGRFLTGLFRSGAIAPLLAKRPPPA